ncbi:MAG: manganese-dependent inorganic pyrophosphatase [Nanobdellota archaeon]
MLMYIVGHKNPDTDTVCAAIALADLKTKLGYDATPAVQGEINPETRFVLEKFRVPVPETVTDGTDKDIYLVDHSDTSQSLDNLSHARLKGIVDHHKLGDITTKEPLEMWVWPVGSTCTVIKAMYDFMNVPLDDTIAGIMLSAILSDTVIFKSATCTDLDRIAAETLADLCGIPDAKTYGMEMFKVKSAIEEATPEELIKRDYKDFTMSGNTVGIGQIEVVDLSLLDSVKEALFAKLKEMKEDRHSILLLLTDIMKEGSELLYVSDDESIIKTAFGVEPTDGKVWLDGVMSRKKQVVPNLEGAF